MASRGFLIFFRLAANGSEFLSSSESNANRMRYAEYQARGLFIGSGVIEAGCKTVIGHRLKQSGMFWEG
jgi:hypothetical protein